MYIPEKFRITDRDVIARLVAAHGFAALVSHTRGGLFATHVPLLLEREGDRDRLVGHVARANPHWRSFDGETEALAVFQGPHAYVSPSWYATAPAVPTWNYAVVHAYGCPRVVEDRARASGIIDRLVAKYENPRPQPWRMSALPAEYVDRMLSAIVAFEMPIDRLEAKFKLSQNRSPGDVEGVLAALSEQGDGSHELVELTRAALQAKGGS